MPARHDQMPPHTLRKTATLGAIESLALKAAMLAPLAPLAVGGLVWLAWQGQGVFGQGDLRTDLWLLLADPFTAVPLLLFASAARRVSMATLGLMQYVSPSIQFLLGIFVYHEPFSTGRGIGFGLIWAALAIYSAESWRGLRRYRAAAAA